LHPLNTSKARHAFQGLVMMVVLLNMRHLAYGMSLVRQMGSWNIIKLYNILTLTDENYGMFQKYKREYGKLSQWDTFKVFSLSHIYWTFGCTFGAILGSGLLSNLKGLEFSLLALFLCIVIDGLKQLYNS